MLTMRNQSLDKLLHVVATRKMVLVGAGTAIYVAGVSERDTRCGPSGD